MNKTSLFSKAILGAAVVSLSLGMASCKDEKKPEDTKEVAEDANEEKFDDTNEAKESDSDYLVFAAETDLKEIELGKLAQKSANADVKSFGKMMQEMHTKAYDELKATAAKKNITIPMALTDNGDEAFKDLNKKTGTDFDKAYADAMVDGHEKAIDKITTASEKAKEEDVRMWAANMLPSLKAHLEGAKTLKTKVDAVK